MNVVSTLFPKLGAPIFKNGVLFNLNKRCINTISEEAQRQQELYLLEQKRQREAIGRIEKIEIQYEGVPENTTLIMNKNISTPFDCANHIGEVVVKKSAVALLNGDTLWHMHKPIPASCKLELLHYNILQPAVVNKTFWRSCCFLLGAIANNAFKDKIEVHLHSFPSPNVRSGSFVYDVQLALDDWVPTINELKVLSIDMIKFCQQNYPIECLDVNPDFALALFKYNPHKTAQIPYIAANNDGKITLYRVGHHIDISRGPMIPNTDHMGRITITNVIKLDTDIQGAPIYRFQGVALPRSIVLNHFAYSLLEERAKKLNSARIPGTNEAIAEDHTFLSQIAV